MRTRQRRGPDRRPAAFERRRREEPLSPPPQGEWRGRVAWILFGAVVATVLAWATPTTKPWEIARAAHRALQEDPPPAPRSHQIVAEFFDQTQSAGIWAHPPVMFEPSAVLMRREFAEFDPRVRHRYEKTALKLWVPQITGEAPLYAGTRVEVIGRALAANVAAPLEPPLVEWVIQLAPITVRGPLVYCRVTDSIARRPQPGLHYVARGLVIAAGSIRLARGGYAPAAFMACSAIRRPYGEVAKFTRVLEETRIDMPELMESSRSEAEFAAAFNREYERILREDPEAAARLRMLAGEGG